MLQTFRRLNFEPGNFRKPLRRQPLSQRGIQRCGRTAALSLRSRWAERDWGERRRGVCPL